MKIGELKGVGPKKEEALAKRSIHRVEDLLYLFPRDYQDRSRITAITSLQADEPALIHGRVETVRQFSGRRRRRVTTAKVQDETGSLEVVFFDAYYISRNLKKGEKSFFYGTPKKRGETLQMIHPEFFHTAEDQGIIPIYPLTAGIGQLEMRKFQRQAVDHAEELEDTLPEELQKEHDLCSLSKALRWIHFPPDAEALEKAKRRLVFDELFILQMGLLMMKTRDLTGTVMDAPGAEDEFADHLSFPLTAAQDRVMREIALDMASDRVMNRLVQGDVGSGKTAIAEIALYKAVRSGRQGALMAPTDLLAKQHYESLRRDFSGLPVRIGFLSGRMKAAEKKEELSKLTEGNTDIIVGTHALLEPEVVFDRLGLVVTDEQHRFGVNQRTKLRGKGDHPDILIMTATPIPRTLAMVFYGDLEVSVIDELPPGRTPIRTKAVTEGSRDQVYEFAQGQLEEGRQIYVVAPLIEESDAVEAASATELFAELTDRFAGYQVGLIHGAMKTQEKDRVMAAFHRGEVDVLVSTVVIEVGIDVKNATVMIVESAERFGLAQLHQLRGRVGRGAEQSYCLLICGSGASQIAWERAKIMAKTGDGFVIAEKDLQLRGPGEVFGTRQHGMPDMHIADLLRHERVMEECRQAAMALLAEDPDLSGHPALLKRIQRAFGQDIRVDT